MNQDPAGHPFVELVTQTTQTMPAAHNHQGGAGNETAAATATATATAYVQAHMAECGGEPDKQLWSFNTPLHGFISNTHAAAAGARAAEPSPQQEGGGEASLMRGTRGVATVAT